MPPTKKQTTTAEWSTDTEPKEDTASASQSSPTGTRAPDRVAMVSTRADGTPDQSADFTVIGKKDS